MLSEIDNVLISSKTKRDQSKRNSLSLPETKTHFNNSSSNDITPIKNPCIKLETKLLKAWVITQL